jgi:hypothetical protein
VAGLLVAQLFAAVFVVLGGAKGLQRSGYASLS